MIGLFWFLLAVLSSPFKSKLRLEAENAVLRHQLIVLRRRLHGRVRLTNHDRLFFIQLYRWFPAILQVLTIIQPDTLVRWHRAGFRCYWRWKSRPRGGRPPIETDLRVLIRRMSMENPLWGAPRIHGELLKLGFEVAESSVAKYMAKRRGPPSQGWCTFLQNHAPNIAAHLEQARFDGRVPGGDLDGFIDAHVRRLEALRRAGIVERIDADHWRLPQDFESRAAAYDAGRNRQINTRVLSAFDLESQVEAEGATWLDRRLVGRGPADLAAAGFGRDVQQAMDRRRKHLIEQGDA